MGRLSEPETIRSCPSCGAQLGDPTKREGVAAPGRTVPILGDDVLLCVACTTRFVAGADWGYRLPTKADSPLPIPKGFDELFKAARVLLKEDAHENQIIPTLALANHLCHGVRRLVAEKERLQGVQRDQQAWAEEAERFARRFGGLRPVRIVQGVLVLERRPVLVSVGYGRMSESPLDAVVTVYPHRTPLATSEEVAAEYGKALSAAGIVCAERRTGHLDYAFFNRRLEIRIRPGTRIERVNVTNGMTVSRPGWRSDEGPFPHPDHAGALYEVLVKMASAEGFAADLPTRRTNKAPGADNLVPACMAFLLKRFGIRPNKAINVLLDDYVLTDDWKADAQDRALFRDAIKGTSPHQQVWDNSRKKSIVRDPLIDAAWTLFWEGNEE